MRAATSCSTATQCDLSARAQSGVEIVGNKFLSEHSRVRAAQLILQRHDMQTEITALKLAIEELKAKKQSEFEHA